ncbi:hypothetical protein WJX72_006159 [[Myrmecia] bisecta]|uniref:Laccase n=1 Tax=[Myrmecia] bisecta TaxID=41462 RepID=A0AAW1Q9E3_9CHLO
MYASAGRNNLSCGQAQPNVVAGSVQSSFLDAFFPISKSVFGKFECAHEFLKIWINPMHLLKALKACGSSKAKFAGSRVQLGVPEGADKLLLSVETVDAGAVKRTKHRISLLDAVEGDDTTTIVDPADFEFTVEAFTEQPSLLTEVIAQLKVVECEEVTVKLDSRRLQFACSGCKSMQTEADFTFYQQAAGGAMCLVTEPDAEYAAKFSFRHFQRVGRICKAAKNVLLQMGPESPLSTVVMLQGGGTVQLFLAPLLDDELGNAVNSSVLLPSIINGHTRTYTLVIENMLAAPDGTPRTVIGINGQLFGPPILAAYGDTVVVHVRNRLKETTTVHMHGILQTGTNNMDGVPGVTQMAIPAGGNYTYTFVADAPGTYWYHSHVRRQYGDGLKGPLIVGGDPSDIILQVSDWYHTLGPVLLAQYINPASMGNEPVPDNALINSIGQVPGCNPPNCTFARVVASADRVPLCSSSTPSRQRIRIINNSAFAVFNVSIDNHALSIIAADGMHTQPVNVSSIRINAAQSPAPAWIRAYFDEVQFATPTKVNGSLAVLSYSANDTSLPTTAPGGKLPPANPVSPHSNAFNFDPYGLIPDPPLSQPKPDSVSVINFKFQNNPMGINLAYINGTSFAVPSEEGPTSLDTMDPIAFDMAQLAAANEAVLSVTNPIFLDNGKVYQFIINNLGNNEHPIHLHGHLTWVLARGDYNAGVYNSSIPLNYANPIGRDTYSINGHSYLVVQFTANNPGAWIMHCHIEWHQLVGFAWVFLQGLSSPPQNIVGLFDGTDGTSGS